MSRLGFGEGASRGVSLARASELSESSDEARPAWDLAGLHKVRQQSNYYILMTLGTQACSDFVYSRLYQGLGPGIPLRAAMGSRGGRLQEGNVPLFGDSASRDEEAVLFYPPPVEGSSSSSSSSSSEEGWSL